MHVTPLMHDERRQRSTTSVAVLHMLLALVSLGLLSSGFVADAAANTTACIDAGRARVTSLLPGECATDESCSVCVVESSAASSCGSEMVCRVFAVEKSGDIATSEDRDIKIEEQWMLVPVAMNTSTLDKMQSSNATNTDEMAQVLATGHL